jgi:hypothetical protein
MFDHIGFPVSNLLQSTRFYQAALEPLGFGLVMELTPSRPALRRKPASAESGKPYFWIGDGEGVCAAVYTSLSRRRSGPTSTRSTRRAGGRRPRQRQTRTAAALSRALLLARSCSTPTATTSKPSAIRPKPERASKRGLPRMITDERG